MKKILLAALAWIGFIAATQAQTLLYQWNFTNTATTTLTSSVPSYSYLAGTGDLLMNPGQTAGGTTNGVGINAYFTNGPGVGPGSGPGGSAQGALVLSGQGYNGAAPTVVTLATNINIGQGDPQGKQIKFTITFWFKLGTSVGNRFPRLLMLGNNTGYDSGSANALPGVGASLNNWILGTSGLNFVANSVQNGIGLPAAGISPRMTDANNGSRFYVTTEGTNGIYANDLDGPWYFEAMIYDGTLTSGQFKSWLGTQTTNVLQVDSQNQNLAAISFGTNAVLFLGNRNNGNRTMSDGQIADVRIYAGVCSSNNLEAIRTFSTGFADDGSGNNNTKPQITIQPPSGSSHVGMSRTFGVGLTGVQPFSYQWKTNGIAVGNATNATLTLTNIPLALNGAAITCTITNALGSTNTSASTLTVIQPASGTYAAAVLAQSPFIYWHVNETTNGSPDPSLPLPIYDYASGLDGSALDPLNTTFNVTGLGALAYPGFAPANIAVNARNNGNFSRLNMASLPRYTNDMTICGWIYTFGTPADRAIIYSMNGGNNGYSGGNNVGFGYGLWFNGAAIDANGNLGGQLSYNWNVSGLNPAPYASGLIVPANEWTFVALTIDRDGTNATLYMGSHSGGLQVSVDDTNATLDVINGTTVVTAPILLGRSPYSFWEQGNGSAFGGNNMAFNDVAVFYRALSSEVITNLYVTGAGVAISGAPDLSVPGNMLLRYPLGTLQSATDVSGPYNDVPGASSPYSVPMTNAASFFRARY